MQNRKKVLTPALLENMKVISFDPIVASWKISRLNGSPMRFFCDCEDPPKFSLPTRLCQLFPDQVGFQTVQEIGQEPLIFNSYASLNEVQFELDIS